MIIDGSELWRTIPPEEKLELMSRAHAKGVSAALLLVVIGCTVAVGLQIQAIIWASLLATPVVFQLAAGKAWRDMRPKTMLEYLAARSAARRYAFANHAKDLGLALMFRARYQPIQAEDDADTASENALEASELPVWVALFNDAMVLLKEDHGGASLVFAHVLNNKLTIKGKSSGTEKQYSADHEVTVAYTLRSGTKASFTLTSKYPGALIVFEKKALQLISKAALEAQQLAEGALGDNQAGDSELLDAMMEAQ